MGQHSLDEVLAETAIVNGSIGQILDTTTLEWGVAVTLVELKDIQLPDTMMAHPLALQLRNLQTLVELGVEKNTTVESPAAAPVSAGPAAGSSY